MNLSYDAGAVVALTCFAFIVACVVFALLQVFRR